MQVFQWHEDTFDIPYGGKLLATSGACPNQSFRYRNAYALQFHIEMTRDMLLDWAETMPSRDGCVRTFETIEGTLYTQAKRIYSNFLWLVDLHRRASVSAEGQ